MKSIASNNPGSVELFVPGRICLFGEHSDWAAQFGRHKGFCLVIGTDQGISAETRPAENFSIHTLVPDALGRPSGRTRHMSCRFDEESLQAAAKDKDEFFRYCAGVAYEMLTHCNVPGGLELRITEMDLPLRKGVSSSAAVCILVAQGFNAIYELGLFPHEIMELAYLGERLTGSQCGRMDQACIYGKTPVLLTFQESTPIRLEPLMPIDDVFMFFVDLGGTKNTIKILADLQKAYPENENLQKALGPENERIVRKAYRALIAGDAKQLGDLMCQAQANFDSLVSPHSPEQLASPLLHELLGFEPIAEHIYGGKGVGSQGDGTAQFVARSAADRDAAMAKITAAFDQMMCFPLTISRSAGPAR